MEYMILEKEFYFVRHGQTDYNILGCKLDHEDVSLNVTGFQQAQAIESVIGDLPINAICFSPLKRAKETKEVISSRLQADHYEIADLGECSMQVWNDMTACGMREHQTHHPHVKNFMQKALNGINKALSYKGPVLVVAHGGIHWALCSLMEISDHDWAIDNCLPIHFFVGTEGQWKAKKIM
jgi:uncharacterized phosphatase